MNALEKKQILQALSEVREEVQNNNLVSLIIISNNSSSNLSNSSSNGTQLAIGPATELVTMAQVVSTTVINSLIKPQK